MAFDFNPQSIGIFAIFAAIGAFWSQVRSFIQRFFSFFIRTDLIEHYDDSRHFLDIILSKGKIIRWGNTTYKTGPREYLKKFDTVYHFIFTLNESFLILVDKNLVIVRANGSSGLKVTYLFGLFNVKKYLEQAYIKGLEFDKELTQRKTKRFYVCERGGKSEVDNKEGSSYRKASFPEPTPEGGNGHNSGIFSDFNFLRQHNNYLLIQYADIGRDLKEEITQSYHWQEEGLKFKKEVKFWLERKKWYEERNLRWVRGACLHGKPGTGKSKMALEVARELDIPIFRFDISSMSNEEFRREYSSVEYGSMVILEDIDTVFNQRENIQQKHLQKQLLTFDGLINVINGIKELSGIFLVVTTNNLHALDNALLRAGRLDAKIEVGNLDEKGRKLIAGNILRDWPEVIDKIVKENSEITVVEFTNICMETAINLFEEEKKLLDENAEIK